MTAKEKAFKEHLEKIITIRKKRMEDEGMDDLERGKTLGLLAALRFFESFVEGK